MALVPGGINPIAWESTHLAERARQRLTAWRCVDVQQLAFEKAEEKHALFVIVVDDLYVVHDERIGHRKRRNTPYGGQPE